MSKWTEFNIKRKLKRKRIILEHLQSHPCIDCGENDIRVLEFDHREEYKKEMSISEMLRTSKMVTIQAEMLKCDIRCCNCHRRRHFMQKGLFGKWYSIILGEQSRVATKAAGC